MAFKNKKQAKTTLTRKQQRKEKRKAKKIRRKEYYLHRNNPGKYALNHNVTVKTSGGTYPQSELSTKPKVKGDISERIRVTNKELTTEEQQKREKQVQKRLQKEMQKQRKEQLIEANKEEDRGIKQLEKLLKLNRKKSKSMPKSFADDGLDYLLDVCDSDNIESIVLAEKQFSDVNVQFEEDLELMIAKSIKKTQKESHDNENYPSEYAISDNELYVECEISEGSDDVIQDGKCIDSKTNSAKEILSNRKRTIKTEKKQSKKLKVDLDAELGSDENNIQEENNIYHGGLVAEEKKDKKFSHNENNVFEASNFDVEDNSIDIEGSMKGEDPDGTWEDIYGRLRTKDGAVINNCGEKYVPPAIRAKLENAMIGDQKIIEKLNRLKKQLKGMLNRLAESNMHSISTQIEELYMDNSRNDMNHSLTHLILETVISNVITPKRLLMDHILLIIVLHANVGTEVGAHFLQQVVKKFDEYLKAAHKVENKMLDNVVQILAQLYNFKLFDAKLLYEILQKLSDKFQEKDIECILCILSSVGFTLRKDDPLALKNLISNLQKQAIGASQITSDNSRVQYMLDILTAIRNNNVTKIPNYDTSYSEHLKRIMKSFIRKGNYVTQLNIPLEDLLEAEEKGKWWVVGSAWCGTINENENKEGTAPKEFPDKLLKLARKQRMNTDTRRIIFCIIMSAEDYLDAFEKLIKLDMKNQREREIIHVILHCCLQEKLYNPYYGVLAQKFCEYDREYQMTIKYSIWDKLKTLNEHSIWQISNLAKLLTHLFLEKGLPISTLKIVEFGQLDKVILRFVRQVLLGILLHEDVETCLGIFQKIAHSEKLKRFIDSLRLFIHHFFLINLKADIVPDEKKAVLQERAKLIIKVLMNKLKF